MHIAPGNAAAVAPLSVVEGLLAGNVNVLKTSGSDTALALDLLAALAAADPSGLIAERVIALRFPSARRDWLETLCGQADAIAVWGGEEAESAVRELAPPGCRVVAWGHRISFAYLTRAAAAEDGLLDALAEDVCRFEQQACSSPQVYLDTEDTEEVFAFAGRFAERLAKVSGARPAPRPGPAELAEITTVQQLARLEQHLGLTRVFTADDGSWRVLADTRSALAASPLHRSVWVKPLPRHRITGTLRPMRRYLQTAAVGGGRADVAALSRALFAAGVTRVTPVGSMLDGYEGEPHDGVYALQRYNRRVSVRAADAEFGPVACLDDLVSAPVLPPSRTRRCSARRACSARWPNWTRATPTCTSAAAVRRARPRCRSSPSTTTTTRCGPRPTGCSPPASIRRGTARPTCSTAAGCTGVSSASSPSWSG